VPSSKRASASRIQPAWATGPSWRRWRFVGWILLTPLDLHGPEIEIGWRLIRAAWGQGFATEAARPVLSHALHTLGLRRVIADIDPDNTASIGVARKLGLAPDGAALHDGRTMIRHVASMTETLA
jgi:RimJ/RimL family protein N-acetyltransferase